MDTVKTKTIKRLDLEKMLETWINDCEKLALNAEQVGDRNAYRFWMERKMSFQAVLDHSTTL